MSTQMGADTHGGTIAATEAGEVSSIDLKIEEGLAGIVIARSRISDVNGDLGTLSFRGYDIGELACHSSYEETIYLLLCGELPTRAQLEAFSQRLAAERQIDDATRMVLEMLPEQVEPMDALRTAVSMISCTDGTNGKPCHESNLDKAISLTAKFPTIVASYYRHRLGLAPIAPNPALGHAANFLYMLSGEAPTELQARSLDLAMIMMAEHGYNASTFAARVAASTLSDMYSAVVAAIGTLKGPLHGGANRRAMEMLLEIGSVETVEPYIDAALAAKKRLMGFGHRVYKYTPDPRSAYLRGRLYELCAEAGDFTLYDVATAVAEAAETKKGLFPNVDFYCAPVMYMVGVPVDLFVSVFAISRIPGWATHVLEQYENNKLIRPLSVYDGPSQPYVHIDAR